MKSRYFSRHPFKNTARFKNSRQPKLIGVEVGIVIEKDKAKSRFRRRHSLFKHIFTLDLHPPQGDP
jgi:hypothetical protein